MRFPSVLLLAMTIASTAVADTRTATVSVTGTGVISAVPDMATITLGVTTQAHAADQAMAGTSSRITAMLAALRAAGIADRDLQTRDLSLQPLWANRSNSSANPPQIDGFVATNTLSVRVRDLTRIGAVLDQVVGLGANTFSGLSFGLQDPQPIKDQARAAAIRDAMRKARIYTDAAGLTLGPVLSISETGGGVPQRFMLESVRSAAPVPVASGEASITASVTMVFGIGS